MKFTFSRENLKGRERFSQRLFEILPGLTSWTILLGMIILSFEQPLVAAIIIIAFDFQWLLRLIFLTIFLVFSYTRLNMDRDIDWVGRVKGIDDLPTYLKRLQQQRQENLESWWSALFQKKALLRLSMSHCPPPPSQDIYHLVILPVAKESSAVIEPGLRCLLNQSFPTKQILVVLAIEERAPQDIKIGLQNLEKKYQQDFFDFLTIFHPADIPGEARVKGANATWAAKQAADYFRSKKIPFDQVIVSCFDADTLVSPEYFACLTYYFMITPQRTRASFQPIPVYHNNIWQAPGFARVMETGSSFFQLIEATNPEKLVTFSSHSMSFQALVDVGYWPVDMISDDSAIFWKSYIHYDGDYRAVPMYITISMDIATSATFWQTFRDIYRQKRRWAWGVENFPIVMRAFLKTRKISFYNKLRLSFKLFEGHISWATWGFLLTVLAWLPTLFARKDFYTTVAYYNTPYVTGTIFHLASFSLLISIFLSLSILPRQDFRHYSLRKLLFALEWLLVPLILVFLSTLPALDAQTRMMLGKRMEFWVSGKRKR
jgi:hypothetical protein